MITLQKIKPQQIEQESFRIIEQEFFSQTGRRVDSYDPKIFKIVQRVIHATGDFSFASNLIFHEQAVNSGLDAIRKGRNVLIDVNMGASGISKNILSTFGGDVICRVGDQEIGKVAKTKGLTRSEVAFDLAACENIGIVAVGNAPTALLAAMQLIEKENLTPDLVIGVPVGFVNAAESKYLLSQKTYPFITALGRKGGSPVAVAIINALLRLAQLADISQ